MKASKQTTMKRSSKIETKETKPFQKRVEETVKNLEALFKEEEPVKISEVILGLVIFVTICLILLYTWYCFVDWYSATLFVPCCCCCLDGPEPSPYPYGCIQGKSKHSSYSNKANFEMVLYNCVKILFAILWTLIKLIPPYRFGEECAPILYKNSKLTFVLTFFLLMPIVT